MLKLQNTLTGAKEKFDPLQEGKVKMYCCGPTVYDYFHIGNARPFIVFDVLRRYLEFRGYEVTFVQNITDVEDKIINRAEERGKEPEEIARKYAEAYFNDLESLGVKKADIIPKVSHMIPEIVDHVQRLIEKGYAYEVEGDVYFRVREFDDYGKLSGRSIDDLQSGARVSVEEKKEDPLDFALWKKAKEGEPKWNSPWGQGRPGWHIECSVMVMNTLGETIDIHAGGEDLIFPHHENEIAQAEAKSGKQFSRFWLHNGLLKYEGEKMSKSLGNFEYARDVVDEFGKEAVRYFYLSTHYRKPLDFSRKNLEDARKAVRGIYNFMREVYSSAEADDIKDRSPTSTEGKRFSQYLESVPDKFIERMDDDFNTPGGLGVIHELVNETNKFRERSSEGDQYLSIKAVELLRELSNPLGLFQGELKQDVDEMSEDLLQLLLETRESLRDQNQWELADEIRNRLEEMGIKIKDSPEGPRWEIVE